MKEIEEVEGESSMKGRLGSFDKISDLINSYLCDGQFYASKSFV